MVYARPEKSDTRLVLLEKSMVIVLVAQPGADTR